ncbi:hypothetical protein SETIT_3G263700v2 [Setaria italica]|uniref:Uncharacterized protein n=1 Tax=Setaria italica TaxID=4555 RepID=A0A368QJ28_SETIT|nr:hypothetical protein SETIT_3G263700v2 [Setaria italica]
MVRFISHVCVQVQCSAVCSGLYSLGHVELHFDPHASCTKLQWITWLPCQKQKLLLHTQIVYTESSRNTLSSQHTFGQAWPAGTLKIVLVTFIGLLPDVDTHTHSELRS